MTQTMVLEKEKVELEKTQQEIALRVQQSPEVQMILRQIDVSDTKALVSFGGKSAEEISRFSDEILRSMQRTQSEDAGDLIGQLNKIMDKFDLKDFEKQKDPNFVTKLFNKAKTSIEAIYKKYETMEGEVGKVNITLKKYEHDITAENEQLDQLFRHNLKYYEDLQRYIVAGEMAISEIEQKHLPAFEEKANMSGDQIDQLNLQNLRQAKTMMEQRVFDLRMAENIALQTMPMIRATQIGNFELIRKINSSFVITLPLFKQALAQTILLKRQDARAKATKALDEKTNELLKRNAENTVLQAKNIAQLTSGSFVQIETLEQTWNTIMTGIEDVKQIYADASVKREEDTKKLEEFKKNYDSKKYLT